MTDFTNLQGRLRTRGTYLSAVEINAAGMRSDGDSMLRAAEYIDRLESDLKTTRDHYAATDAACLKACKERDALGEALNEARTQCHAANSSLAREVRARLDHAHLLTEADEKIVRLTREIKNWAPTMEKLRFELQEVTAQRDNAFRLRDEESAAELHKLRAERNTLAAKCESLQEVTAQRDKLRVEVASLARLLREANGIADTTQVGVATPIKSRPRFTSAVITGSLNGRHQKWWNIVDRAGLKRIAVAYNAEDLASRLLWNARVFERYAAGGQPSLTKNWEQAADTAREAADLISKL